MNDLIPEIGTTAAIDDEKEVCATEVFTLTDTVEYKHLVPGKEYTLKGILMDKATGEPFLQNGEQITSEVTFVPEAPSGSVEVLFTFDAKLIKTDTSIVVFESLYSDSKELTVHADIEDEAQTVTVIVPEIKTEASTDGKKETTIGGEITIEDIVSYHNLTPGKEYVVKGTLMNKTTGKPVTVNDEPVTAEDAFTPETRDGEVKVAFIFNSYVITETTDVVVFESLYREEVEIAVHADIEDEGQSVKVYVPEIKTTASIDGKQEITTAGKVTIEDVVSYTNLIPGTEYTIRGTLMNKATGEVFTVNGETITAEVKFTPKDRNGEVKVKFVFDASGITKSTSLVVFESLYRDDVEITTHKDIEDKDQTVTITPPPDIPKTGDTTNIPLWGALTGISLLGAGVVAFFTFRKKKEENGHERYCYTNPQSKMPTEQDYYGVRVDTDKYTYLLRLNPNKGEYNLYCYCYVKDWLNGHMKDAAKGIRFINSHYKELFRIPDGGKIKIHLAWNEDQVRTCRYIDDYHVEIGDNLYHICEFAERMEQNGHTYEPVRTELPEQCYSILPGSGEIIVVKRNEKG